MAAELGLTARIPSPTGGWNARDPLPGMQPDDAVVLENMIPGTAGVNIRGGTFTFATGMPAAVNTLMRYNPANGNPSLFAASGANFYDVSDPGAVGAPVVTGNASSEWQSQNFANPAGPWLIAANGIDPPKKYNGSAWSNIAMLATAGYAYTLTPSLMMAPFVFGSRLWFIENNSLRIWYMPVSAVGTTGANAGTAMAVFDLSSLFKLGGQLTAMASWTRDGGTGSDDYAVLITDAGEVAIYSGYDPTATVGQAGAFSLVGVFRIAPPIGPRCVIKAGADLCVLTQQGAVPLSSVLPLALSQATTQALTDKIRGAFTLAFAQTPSAFGWEMAEYPKGSLLIINVPRTGTTPQQYVMNVLTGCWCNFNNVLALTWALSGDNCFYGTADGRVMQYDVGFSDDGQAIAATVIPAYSAFKTLSKKRFTLARPLFLSALGYSPPISCKVDYDTNVDALQQPMIPGSNTPWGSPWGSPWGPAIGPAKPLKGIRGVGQVGTVQISISTENEFRLDHIDIRYEVGGFI